MNYIKRKAYHNKYKLYKYGILKIVNGKTVKVDRLNTLLYEYMAVYKSQCDPYHIFDKDHDLIFQYIDLIKNQKKLPTDVLKPLFWQPNISIICDDPINSISYLSTTLERMYFRNVCIQLIGFPLLTGKFIDNLAEYLKGKKVLEIMSGCGSLSYFLEEKGIKCITTDNYSWEDRWNIIWKKPIKLDAVKAIEKYGKSVDYVLMSWAYMDDTAYRCLNAMRKVNPNLRMLYIGEGAGGATANDKFFEAAEENMNHLHNLGLISHYGIHDQIFEIK